MLGVVTLYIVTTYLNVVFPPHSPSCVMTMAAVLGPADRQKSNRQFSHISNFGFDGLSLVMACLSQSSCQICYFRYDCHSWKPVRSVGKSPA